MIYAIIAVAIIVVALCLHYSTPSYGPKTESPMQDDESFDVWDEMGISGAISDGSDGSLPGDPWGTNYPDD